MLPPLVLQNQKNYCQISCLLSVAPTCSAKSKRLLTYCSPCFVLYVSALLGGRILRIRTIAEGRLCAECPRSGDTGSTSAISVSRVRKNSAMRVLQFCWRMHACLLTMVLWWCCYLRLWWCCYLRWWWCYCCYWWSCWCC